VPLARISLVLAIALPAIAQPPTFSAGIKLVTLQASVRDRDGRIVKDLTRDDFQLDEDGQAQTIRNFSKESNLPLNIGLLVDTSRSQIKVLERERTASNVFLDKVLLQEKDRAFVLHFDVRVSLLQGFTSSRQELERALSQLRIPPKAATLLFDAVKEASEELMKNQDGRKAYIVLSDGVDVRSKNSIGTAIEYAQRADTMIYCIVFANHVLVAHPAVIAVQEIYLAKGRKAMHRLAEETGGGYFQVSHTLSIEAIYSQIEEELRNQYSIGYVSDRSNAEAGYRTIHLSVKGRDYIVQSRRGYYSVKE
jgi:VWFA-related protein